MKGTERKKSQHYLVRNSQAAAGRGVERILYVMWNRENLFSLHYALCASNKSENNFRRSFCHIQRHSIIWKIEFHSTVAAAAAAAAAFYQFFFLVFILAICGREQKEQNIADRVASLNGFLWWEQDIL